jgi:hypothetical protein
MLRNNLMMFILSVIVSLSSLRTANLCGEYWINVSWVAGVWFGYEAFSLLNKIKEVKHVMGLTGDLKRMADEYRKDPSGQYWKNLQKMLNLHTTGKVSKHDVYVYVKKWAEE